jgi:hypothetical protein
MAKSFDPVVAKALLAQHFFRLRSASYAELAEKARDGHSETFEAADADGDVYQMENSLSLARTPARDARVMGFAFMNPSGKSVSDSFILAPDGTVVGE